MRVAVPHNTTKDRARTIIEQRLGDLTRQFGHHADDVDQQWYGDTLKFKGKARGLTVEGTVDVTDEMVIIDGKLPLIARAFEGRIRQTLQSEAEKMFRA
jgi:putative polyhydroxyalkanoate system protein